MVYDPDAPTGSGFWHWVMFNIPADATGLAQGAGDASRARPPAGAIQTRNDFGAPGYDGPCPPPGDPAHHYHFMLFAVDAAEAWRRRKHVAAVIGFNLHFHTLAKTEFVGVYGH